MREKEAYVSRETRYQREIHRARFFRRVVRREFRNNELIIFQEFSTRFISTRRRATRFLRQKKSCETVCYSR